MLLQESKYTKCQSKHTGDGGVTLDCDALTVLAKSGDIAFSQTLLYMDLLNRTECHSDKLVVYTTTRLLIILLNVWIALK